MIENNIDSIINFELRFKETHEIFYHGQNSCHIFKDLISQALLDEDNYYIYDETYSNFKSASDIYNELNNKYQLLPNPPQCSHYEEKEYKFQGSNTTLNDHHQLLGSLVISCLKCLHQNVDNYNESVIKYINEDNIKVNSKNIIKLISKKLNIDKIKINKLNNIYRDFKEEFKTGQILIIAIPKDKISKYVYTSKYLGIPFKIDNILDSNNT